MPSLELPSDSAILQEVLRQIMDPEVGLNIVDLGLIYRLELTAAGVEVDMTMTSPACPMSESIIEGVETALAASLPPGSLVDVQLVWSPPWSAELMSEEARAHFGWDD